MRRVFRCAALFVSTASPDSESSVGTHARTLNTPRSAKAWRSSLHWGPGAAYAKLETSRGGVVRRCRRCSVGQFMCQFRNNQMLRRADALLMA
jgi:hypothetical protein